MARRILQETWKRYTMKVLITGSEGFVGREFQRQLASTDWDVYTNDLKPSLGMSNRAHYQGDCRAMFRAVSADRDLAATYDLVIHLAAIVGGRETIENHPLTVADDLSIDAEMFQWAVATKQKRVVYYSSSAAYPIGLQTVANSDSYRNVYYMGGETSRFLLKESDISLDNIAQPDMTYGWAKLTGEYLATFAESEGVPVHVFRPFSGYGEDQDLAYPFPSFIDRANRRADPFQIWGDGNQFRDFIHISDVVSGTLEAVRNVISGPTNLCTGRATDFNELASLVTYIADYSPAIEHLNAKPTGVQFRVGNPEKMLSFYTPKISLEEGIARALKA